MIKEKKEWEEDPADNCREQGTLCYPLVRRTLVIDINDWKWLQSHRDEYQCRSVSQLLRVLINLERAEKTYRARVGQIASRENDVAPRPKS